MPNRPEPLSPDERIETIQHSVRCFQFGLASIFPLLAMPLPMIMMCNHDQRVRTAGAVLGTIIVALSLPLSLAAARNYRRARVTSKGQWNPAKNVRVAGEIMSSLGVLLSLILVVMLVASYMQIFP